MRELSAKRILVSIPTAVHTQRLKLEGLLQYAKDKRGDPWMLQLDLGGFSKQRLLDLPGWKCDGIVAYVDNPKNRAELVAAAIPTVLIEPYPPDDRRDFAHIVSFVNDYKAEGRTAARHFLEHRFTRFAYVGTPENTPWSELRYEGFADELSRNGRRCIRYPRLPPAERNDFALEMPRLTDWLKALPRPTAVFVAHDIRARQVLVAANAQGIAVPQDVAVLGVDNDELLCETATPPLSSIPTSDMSLGYACGRALDELLKHRAKGRTIDTRHSRVVSRASTDIVAVGDPFVARALSYASRHLRENPTTDEIAARTGYSKRLLQIRIRKTLGTTLGSEIRKMRLSAAAELLAGTDQPAYAIAEACGYSHVSHMSMQFVRAFHMTPLAFRRRERGESMAQGSTQANALGQAPESPLESPIKSLRKARVPRRRRRSQGA